MNKILIEMQRGLKATAVIIEDKNRSELDNALILDAKKINIDTDKETALKIEVKSKLSSISYLIIRGIDCVSEERQLNWLSLVKDRMICNHYLPENTIIVFTIAKEKNLIKISNELYRFCMFCK